MVFSVFITASTLLYHSKHSKDNDEETRKRLQLCIHWLSALGKSWKTAGARHKMLSDSEYDVQYNRVSVDAAIVFDLPPELRGQQDQGNQDSPSMAQVVTPGQTPSSHPYGSPIPRNDSAPPAPMAAKSPEDWTFLREFGDANDEFYELDVQLRGLLDGGFTMDQISFLR
jgi:hypothetical protein